MFKNYFTVAIRNLRRNKLFSLINILGLAIGISASLVIYLLVSYHFGFDTFQKDRDRIYRVVSNFNFSGEIYRNSGVTSPIGPAMQKELTGLDAVVPFRTWNNDVKISVPDIDKKDLAVYKHQANTIFADEHFFNLIGYQWIAGSATSSLQKPYQTVLSETGAAFFFPKLSATQIIGRQIHFNDTVLTTVTGIVKDLPRQTDFTFTTFISRATLENTNLQPGDWTEWNNTNSASQLLVKLSPGTNPQQLEKRIYELYEKYHKATPGDNTKRSFSLQPLHNIHFNADYNAYNLAVANKPTLYGLLAVAAFLLLLGCINFINLTTAQAVQRAKEIGIRKTLGSSRKQLIFQFFSETFLLTLLATIISVLLTPLILKAFSGFMPEGLHFNLIRQPFLIIFLLVLMAIVTLLSGFYPALLLSRYKPVLVLKNTSHASTGTTRNAGLRKSLTVSQFVIAQVFIMATILVSRQINYLLTKNMGFKKDAIVHFRTNFYDTVQSHKSVLLTKLRAIPEINKVSLSTSTPSSGDTWSSIIKYKDGSKEIEADVQQKLGDTNYIPLYHLQLLAGRNLSASDTVKEYLINETYMHLLGFQNPQQVIGKRIEWDDKSVPIVGVVADFNQKSLHERVKPLVIGSWTNSQRLFNIALQPQNTEGTTWKTAISKIEKAFKEVYPNDDFEYSFFDEDIAKYYEQEQQIASLLKWATGLAIFISCLGLLSLVTYTTAQRTKEIGVRKVLGASVSQIVTIISKEFLWLVLIAFAIAVPLAWIFINKWLQSFAYRTEVSLWMFILAGAVAAFLALFTISFQTIKAAIANPVKSLRSE